MHDDGTNGDEVGGDHVWSATVTVPPGVGSLFYNYYEGEQVEVESLPPLPSSHAKRFIHWVMPSVVMPVDVFADFELMVERMHPNRVGHAVIAGEVAARLPSFTSFQRWVASPGSR
jgi:hypothetical protein